MPTVKEAGRGRNEFTEYLCKDYKCEGEEDYMISIPVPKSPFWKEFYVDICVVS